MRALKFICAGIMFFAVFTLVFWNEEIVLHFNNPPLTQQLELQDTHNTSTQFTRQRPQTLVVYVYSEKDDLKKHNLDYFLSYLLPITHMKYFDSNIHGLCENCTTIDFVVMINGLTNFSYEFPHHTNLEVLYRNNDCGDFGAWDELFKQMDPVRFKKYKRFMFINDTVKGPYVDPTYRLLYEDIHFTDLFGMYLTSETRIVGSYISCGGVSDQITGFISHVQSMSIMMDDVAMELVRPLIKCYEDKLKMITECEIGMSKTALENNINIASLLYAYRDFRVDTQLRETCNGNGDPTFDGNYFGMQANPMEVVFFKDTRGNNMQTLDHYTTWTERKQFYV